MLLAVSATPVFGLSDGDGSSPAIPGIRYTLVQSVEQALRANPAVEAAYYAVEGAGAEVGIARGQMLPSLTLSAGRTYVNSISSSGQVDIDYIDQYNDNASLQAIQTLFSGMSLLKNYQKAQLNEELAEAEKLSVEASLILEVQTTFLDLLKARGDVRTLEEALNRLRKSVEAAKAFTDVKLAPYVDVLQAEADFADTQQRLSRARIEVANHNVYLNALLGLPPQSPTTYVGDLSGLETGFPWTLEECLAQAEQQRAEIEVARKSVAVAQKQAEVVLGGYWPKVDLQMSYVHQGRDYDQPGTDPIGNDVDRDYTTDYWTAGINLQWRLFEGTRNYYEYQRARSEIGRLSANLRDIFDQVQAEVETYYQSLKEARERIESTATGLDLARESHERAQVRFEARVGTIIELLDAQARLTRAETSLSQARADYQTALARLLYAMGERSKDLQL